MNSRSSVLGDIGLVIAVTLLSFPLLASNAQQIVWPVEPEKGVLGTIDRLL